MSSISGVSLNDNVMRERGGFTSIPTFISDISTDGRTSDGGDVAEDKKSSSATLDFFPSGIDEDQVQTVRHRLHNPDMLQRWYVPSLPSSGISSPKESIRIARRNPSDGADSDSSAATGFQQTVAAELDDCMAEARRRISGSRRKLAAARQSS